MVVEVETGSGIGVARRVRFFRIIELGCMAFHFERIRGPEPAGTEAGMGAEVDGVWEDK